MGLSSFSWKGISLPNLTPTAVADRPAAPTNRYTPTVSSRIATDQVFDFIDGARLGFALLTNRLGSGHATSARFPRSSSSTRYCRPGDPPPRRLSSVRSHGLPSRRYPRPNPDAGMEST